MIYVTIHNNGESMRHEIKEFEGDEEPKTPIRLERLLEWNEEDEMHLLDKPNRIVVDRLIPRK